MEQLSTMTEEKPAIIDVKLYSYIRHAGLVTKYKKTNVEKKKTRQATGKCHVPVISSHHEMCQNDKGPEERLSTKKNSAIMHI